MLIQVPDVQFASVLSRKQQLRVETALHHIRSAPFGGDHCVVPKVPPEIVSQVLGAALLLPWAFQLKRIRIHEEDAARTIATGRTEGAAINAIGATMNGMWRCVAGLLSELFWLDHFHDLGMVVTRFRIQDVNPGRCDTRNDQVTTFHVRVWVLRAETSAAGVPAEMM